jgi:hypothetical protein
VERPSHRPMPAQTEAFEARFALRLTARLDDAVQAFPHDISERLRVARMQAVSAARATAAVRASQTAPQVPVVSQAGLALAGGSGQGSWAQHPGHQRDQHHGRRLDEAPTGWGWRLASALPILALVVGLWGINQWYQHEQVQAAADVDMALLSDDLPPAAYTDPGFEEFLRANFTEESPSATEGEPESDTPAVETLENRDPTQS